MPASCKCSSRDLLGGFAPGFSPPLSQALASRPPEGPHGSTRPCCLPSTEALMAGRQPAAATRGPHLPVHASRAQDRGAPHLRQASPRCRAGTCTSAPQPPQRFHCTILTSSPRFFSFFLFIPSSFPAYGTIP